MHVRRALLLFALVLGLTALATSIAPTSRPADTPQVAPPPAAPVAPTTTVTLHAPGTAPRSYPVKSDAHVLVQVSATTGGQVEIPKLGQLQAIGAGSSAEFDVVDLAAGRYDVLFEAAIGAPIRIGTLVSR
jgi:hypothetical protein